MPAQRNKQADTQTDREAKRRVQTNAERHHERQAHKHIISYAENKHVHHQNKNETKLCRNCAYQVSYVSVLTQLRTSLTLFRCARQYPVFFFTNMCKQLFLDFLTFSFWPCSFFVWCCVFFMVSPFCFFLLCVVCVVCCVYFEGVKAEEVVHLTRLLKLENTGTAEAVPMRRVHDNGDDSLNSFPPRLRGHSLCYGLQMLRFQHSKSSKGVRFVCTSLWKYHSQHRSVHSRNLGK